MELDKRIINKSHPYNCFETAYVKHLINKKGWFSNNLEDFANLESSKIIFKILKIQIIRLWLKKDFINFFYLSVWLKYKKNSDLINR